MSNNPFPQDLNHTNLTDKQYRILTVICTGNGKDEKGLFVPVDLDELLDRLSYRTSKESMQFSIRALIKNRLVSKDYQLRRGSRRAIYSPSKIARTTMGYGNPSIVETPEESFLAHALINLNKGF
jgi:hypothetical protein